MGLSTKREHFTERLNPSSRRVLFIDDAVSSQFSDPNYGLDLMMRDLLAFIDPAIELEVADTEDEAMRLLGLNQYDLVILNFRLHGTQNTPRQSLVYRYGTGKGEGGMILNALKNDTNLCINRDTPIIGFSHDWSKTEVRAFYNAQDLVYFSKPFPDTKQFMKIIKYYLNL